MANLVLAIAVLALLLVWRRTSFRVPPRLGALVRSPRRIAAVAGFAVVVATLGYSAGDVLAGRTQVSKSPVRYATRMQGAEAHHHDLLDAGRFWRQILFQTGLGLTVGATIIALSGFGRSGAPQRA